MPTESLSGTTLSGTTDSDTPSDTAGGARQSGDAVVSCVGLTKCYGNFQALIDCSLEVRQGDIFGLLGPNGAGKTTLIRTLLGYLQISAGRASVCGYNAAEDAVAVRSRVAYLPGDARLPRHMRGDGVLRFFADIHPAGDLKRSRQIADALELDTRRLVGMMSTGMRQKLALAVVLSPQTPLLILDEPTANLDPSVRATVLELVVEANRDGRTVMFSSHVLSEIEETCNRVAFLRKGRLALELDMVELFQRHRVWGELAADVATDDRLPVEIPEEFGQRIQVSFPLGSPRPGFRAVRIDTSGDLSPMLPWISSLPLRRVRIEPLGLRAVYESVHRQQVVGPPEQPGVGTAAGEASA
jgi:ABC-2 type transport system ATP-binding protein